MSTNRTRLPWYKRPFLKNISSDQGDSVQPDPLDYNPSMYFVGTEERSTGYERSPYLTMTMFEPGSRRRIARWKVEESGPERHEQLRRFAALEQWLNQASLEMAEEGLTRPSWHDRIRVQVEPTIEGITVSLRQLSGQVHEGAYGINGDGIVNFSVTTLKSQTFLVSESGRASDYALELQEQARRMMAQSRNERGRYELTQRSNTLLDPDAAGTVAAIQHALQKA